MNEQKKNSKAKPKRPDRDVLALKACCEALESCSSRGMIRATLDFLNSKYGTPGVV